MDRKEAHTRQVLEHSQKVADQTQRATAEFEASCRAFWDFLRRHDTQQRSRLKSKVPHDR